MLLQKGIRETPDKWQYYHDAGFVEYLVAAGRSGCGRLVHESVEAAQTHRTGCEPLAASVLAEHGERDASRALWTQLAATAEHEWIRQAAKRGLMQLDAEAAHRDCSNRSSRSSST